MAETARGRAVGRHVVTRVQPKGNGYYKAWLDIMQPGTERALGQAVWVFRRTETGWLHSEILNEEIGPRKRLETEHFELAYFVWDDDVIERIGSVAERAFSHVTERTGLIPETRTAISVNPTYGSHSALRGSGTWAIYMPGADTILIRSIESYGAGITARGESQEDRLLVALTHEYAHLVNNHVVPTVKMPKWMVEGFAEYVAENFRSGSMVSALRSGRTMTLETASDVIEWGLDPSRGYTGADIDLAYAHSAHATAYVMERFGQARFFELAADYGETRAWEASLSKTLGISAADLERDWLAWTRRRLG